MQTSNLDDATWLALDVGGANLKAAHSHGAAWSRSFALWRDPERLTDELRHLCAGQPAFDALALTMTAELCDCFESKAAGVHHVLDAACTVVPPPRIAVWGLDGRFHPVEAIRADPRLAMASNWLALASAAARSVSEGMGLLVDIGSTTTDVLALAYGRPAPIGLTDTERLASGELVYAGVRRTPLCALASQITWRGGRLGVMAEFFATTHDVYLILGDLSEARGDTATADGRPATRAAARRRLARMVGADASDFDPVSIDELAVAFDVVLRERIARAIEQVAAPHGMPRRVIVSGMGAFLAERIARSFSVEVANLTQLWGESASVAACAFALLQLVRDASRFAR
jgi:probable H4MPT-linked C1 transfer pathway protein